MRAAATLAVFVAVLAGGASTATARAACPTGRVAWQMGGHRVCALAPRVPAPGANLAVAATDAWLSDALNPTGPHRRGAMPAATVRAVLRAGHALALRATQLRFRGTPAARNATRAVARTAGAAIIDRQDLGSRTQQLGDGATLTVSATMVALSDASVDLRMTLEVDDGHGNRTRMTPITSGLLHRASAIGCPTADGTVTATDTQTAGGTLTMLHERRVLSSTTDRATLVATSTGHVGADARLQAVSTKTQLKLGHYARGLQLDATLGATIELRREGSGTLSGPPSVEARARIAGATAAQERATAAAYGTQLANDQIVGVAIAAVAPELRARLLAAEPSWYDVPNDCVDIDYTPTPSVRLDPGQRASVSARVHPTHSEGDATGTIAVTAVSHGTFTAARTAAAPGAPALFGAVAGDPVGSFMTTVDADLLATSTAGRAKRGWFAIGEPPAAPGAFIGTIALDQTMPGYGWAFAGVGNYTRTALTTSPDGTTEAWYALDAASLSTGSNRIGDGCGWIGQTSGSGAIDGDLELRIPAGGGSPTYAIRYEVEIDGVVFAPQCLGLEPFVGTVSVRLDSGRPGPAPQRLRPGPAGFHLSETDVADVTVLAGAVANASWDLLPR